jgi:SAM-dependent methyltransferase
MDIFFEIHQNLPRESPGGDDYTRQAWQLLPPLSQPQILDIGCGAGAQSLVLAGLTDGHITAIDTHQPFLDQLQAKAAEQGLSDRITCLNQSMLELPFPAASFDLIWSEGAIYIIGFDRGLQEWHSLIKPSRFLVISELVWLKPDPPQEVQTFWQQAYPGMLTLDQALNRIPQHGYKLIGHFTLPENAWWQGYYLPIEAKINQLRSIYSRDPEALATLESERQEIEMYRKYHNWYGYEFFVLQTL